MSARACFYAIFGLCLAAAPNAAAAEIEGNGRVLAGQVLRLGNFSDLTTDCKPLPAPEVRVLEPPKNGVITTSSATLRVRAKDPCGMIIAPVSVVFYKPAADYVGEDKVAFEVISKDDAPQKVTITITVVPRSGGRS